MSNVLNMIYSESYRYLQTAGFSDILLWLVVIYIGGVVIWRLFLAIILVISGYQEMGFGGALFFAGVSFFKNLWDFAKFAFLVLIFSLIFRTCDSRDNDKQSKGYLEKGITYFEQQNIEKAIENFIKAKEKEPKSLETHELLGTAYFINGDMQSARNYLYKAVKLGSKNHLVFAKLGMCYAHLQNYSAAEKYFKKSLLIKESSEVYLGFALLNFYKKDMDAGLNYLRKSLSKITNDTHCDMVLTLYASFCSFYSIKGDYDKIIYYSQIAVNKYKNHCSKKLNKTQKMYLSMIYLYSGCAYIIKDNSSMASQYLQKAAELGNQEAKNVLREKFNY